VVILGLTGSIAMGKTTAANAFRRLGVPIHDADAEVHRVLGRNGAAVPLVEKAFPGVAKNGAVDRAALGAKVFGDPNGLKRLEGILHPLVARSRDRFLRHAARHRRRIVMLDIPLLYEVGADKLCDAVVVVSAPRYLQRIRALRRPGMTPERLTAVLARQLPDQIKRARADFIVPTGLGRATSLRQIRIILKVAQAMTGRHWPPR
jgi:dephospho-CoA kinase